MGLKLGIGLDTLKVTLKPLFKEAATNAYLTVYPFDGLLPALDVRRVCVFESLQFDSDHWPQILVAEFSDEKMTSLTDAILIRNGVKRPLVAGTYQKWLENLKPGTSTSELYRLLGKDECEFDEASANRWVIRFTYYGVRGAIYAIEVDPCTAMISEVKEVSL